MKKKSQASYNAIAFQKNLPEGDLVNFRIQFMCNCLEWNAVSLTDYCNRHSTVHVSVAAMFIYLVPDGTPGTTRMED